MSALKKIALVTGAGSGIGKAAALALAKDGYTVILAGRREERLIAVAEEIRSKDGNYPSAVTAVVDVGDSEAVKGLFADIQERFGRLDLLFNNAGRGNPPGAFTDWDAGQWREVVDTNLNGMFFCLQQAFRMMRDQHPQGGRIINNGSLAAYSPRPNSIAYTATKHAVTGLTKAASLDGRAFSIAVGQIDVGNAMSELASRMAAGVPQANGELKAEPLIDASLVGQAVVYMASLPLEANILFHTIMATNMPFVGRG
ncbi:SDR family oxidoreductase [Pseudomonas sp. PLB05]|uniref:SDR family oxidoreductase n=1 Tax=Pseudomonas sp. PLB05 TaxID=2899078 RepID=UPI001E409559|nr:SDR family NAD(P)-dependent oxidoreductase [Pseudomonas sp. PLB05]MCD4865234.1 SDR family oxidoreductase [Pseudomonas sp. PLB05]